MIVAFDTNILLYAADARDPRKQGIAVSTLQSHPGGMLLWQVGVEFIASSRRLYTHGMTAVAAWDLLGQYVDAFQLVMPTPAVLLHARSLHVDSRWSFWDAMIVGACLEAGVKRLYSEDLPGSRPPDGIEIINPFA